MTSNHHGEDAGGFLSWSLCMLACLARYRVIAGDQVGESGVVQNPRGRVTHIKKDLVQRPVVRITVNQFA